MPKCVIDILIVEPFTWHSVVSLFNCPRHPLPESLVYGLQKKKRQHYFLQKLTSRLNQGASYQYYKSRRCCQSVSQSVSDVCQVQVHFCVQLTSHLSESGFCSSAISERLKWPFVLAAVEEERKRGACLKDAALRLVVVSQANRGY